MHIRTLDTAGTSLTSSICSANHQRGLLAPRCLQPLDESVECGTGRFAGQAQWVSWFRSSQTGVLLCFPPALLPCLCFLPIRLSQECSAETGVELGEDLNLMQRVEFARLTQPLAWSWFSTMSPGPYHRLLNRLAPTPYLEP